MEAAINKLEMELEGIVQRLLMNGRFMDPDTLDRLLDEYRDEYSSKIDKLRR